MSTSALHSIGSTVYFISEAIPGSPVVRSGVLVEAPRPSCFIVDVGYNAYTSAVFATYAEAAAVAQARTTNHTVADQCAAMGYGRGRYTGD